MRLAPSTRLLRALSPALLALFGLAPVGCASEIAMCQVDGMKYENAEGMLQVWVNPVLYIRNFGSDIFESSNVVITVLNGNEVVVPAARFQNFSADPGGLYYCPRAISAMGSMQTGITIPRLFPRTARLALSVKVDVVDTTGSSRSFTVPVGQMRFAQEGMPSFSCSSMRCGR